MHATKSRNFGHIDMNPTPYPVLELQKCEWGAGVRERSEREKKFPAPAGGAGKS